MNFSEAAKWRNRTATYVGPDKGLAMAKGEVVRVLSCSVEWLPDDPAKWNQARRGGSHLVSPCYLEWEVVVNYRVEWR